MVGIYPKGKNWGMCYGKEEEERKVKVINGLGGFTKDAIYDKSGPGLEV